MLWLATMFMLYLSLAAGAVFLFATGRDQAQRAAMLFFISAFVLLSIVMLAAMLNGYGVEARRFLRTVKHLGTDSMFIGVSIMLGRLLWKEWVCGDSPRC